MAEKSREKQKVIVVGGTGSLGYYAVKEFVRPYKKYEPAITPRFIPDWRASDSTLLQVISIRAILFTTWEGALI